MQPGSCAIDPGVTNLLYVAYVTEDGVRGTMKLTGRQYRHDSGQHKITVEHARAAERFRLNHTDLVQGLKDNHLKTADHDQVLRHVRLYLQNQKILWEEAFKPKYREGRCAPIAFARLRRAIGCHCR